MNVGISEINKLKNYCTGFYEFFCKMICVVSGRFLVIEIFDLTRRKNVSA